MFQFVATLEKTRERAIYMKRQEAENEEGLRASWIRFDYAMNLISSPPQRCTRPPQRGALRRPRASTPSPSTIHQVMKFEKLYF